MSSKHTKTKWHMLAIARIMTDEIRAVYDTDK